ncbi:hypothetical protein HU200_056217 [Digitaria exilis]|uniref:DUF4220 domain-containing protein n=1 Tax=Digitaria exilis TaxID=1010633 RepID=A0A835AS42_9POAL|nr:hypothetical protein HU200_056217 [Digitaria exilis]
MEYLIRLFYNWEIQLLVLLSFAIQIFLFFTVGLQHRSANLFLRFCTWIAYLGADLVAVYAFGYLSRHTDATTVAFFWAPFLLIHLGGQDTITAFSMEDNNLWLRHLLNLVVQVVLAIYVFWRSIEKHNWELLVSSLFLFVVGFIKYGERTWALNFGSLKSLESTTGNHYKYKIPEMNNSQHDDYSNIVCIGLHSMQDVLDAFSSRTFRLFGTFERRQLSTKQSPKSLEIELAMMSDDLYTKARVLRTKSGIMLRCISQLSSVVSFILFLECDRRHYSRVDIAITYSLFIGIFFLEVCAIVVFMMSPWTWAWLKAQRYNTLSRFSWAMFSNPFIGWPEKRPMWSNTMGQYDLMGWLSDSEQSKSCNQKLETMASNFAEFFGAKRENTLWMNKMLATEYVKADKLLKCLIEGVSQFAERDSEPHWPNIDPFLAHANNYLILEFGHSIVFIHAATEIYLRAETTDSEEENTKDLVETCRQLSRYMMYLLVNHPSLLPLRVSAVDTLRRCQSTNLKDDVLDQLGGFQALPSSKEILKELRDLWTRLIIYAAAYVAPIRHHAAVSPYGHGGHGDTPNTAGIRVSPRILILSRKKLKKTQGYGRYTGGIREAIRL